MAHLAIATLWVVYASSELLLYLSAGCNGSKLPLNYLYPVNDSNRGKHVCEHTELQHCTKHQILQTEINFNCKPASCSVTV